MTAPIRSIPPVLLPEGTVTAGASPSGGQFRDVLASAIQQVEQFGKVATGSVRRVLDGEGEELHAAILATQRAEMTFDLFLQARNKVVQAYQEIMRMQM